ncbi:TDT family transporter [Ferrimonas marina]|uniref:Tellurite resistance protein TehA n=1 Tax=Ferrimonas marina TaxID=299255 RepID=A0A1M5X1Z8_9GAMM|nr:TDT family transporter [Ferrimonas marina]SHH93839.1 Tellurite resistance protein TehA [Ferrimonas marina]
MPFAHSLNRIPTPLAGLALGIASLGLCLDQRLGGQGQWQLAAALLAGLLLLLLLLKFLLNPGQLKQDLAHAVVGSVIPTFAMATMVIATSLYRFLPQQGLWLWQTGVALHLMMLLSFLYHRVKQPGWHHVVPSWFVPPVGIIVAAVTCPSDDVRPLATALLYGGMLAYAVTLPLMLYRLIFHANVPEPAKPTIAILAAPASLSLAGYLNLVSEPNALVVALLLGIALLMTALIYLAFFHLLQLPFSPGYAAFTFPMVIGATALYQSADLFRHWQLEQANLLHHLADIELVIATAVVTYVGLRYLAAYWPRFGPAQS